MPEEQVPGTAELQPSEGGPDAPCTLSELLWELDWSRLLPLPVGDDVFATRGSFQQGLTFVQTHYAEIFDQTPDDHRFLRESMTRARIRYLQHVADFFVFLHHGRAVALMIGTPLDWSSYYLRSGGILKDYQGGVYRVGRFIKALCEWLRQAGVARAEIDTAPSNLAMIQLLTRFRFNPIGTNLSDRWGATLRFARFLDPSAERTFLRQYCTGVDYQLRQRSDLDP